MDGSTTAAFVALALCIPLIGVVFALRAMAMWSFMERIMGKNRQKPPKLPPGRSPYHLP